MKPKTLLLIDTNALLHRAWHALPILTTANGEVVNALYGVLLMLFRVLPELKPNMVVATFDLKGPTFRHELYKQYKAQRVKQPDELYEQIPKLKEILKAMKIGVVEKQGFEADDCIGSLALKAQQRKPPISVKILTGDMDTLQLVNDTVHVIAFKKGVSETIEYDPRAVWERFGISPDQLGDYKALRGDPSDNIPGVKGIGEKTAAQLLQTYHTIEGIQHELKKNQSAIPLGVKRRFEAPDVDLALNKKLVEIDCTLDLPLPETDDPWPPQGDTSTLIQLLRRYEFATLLRRLPSVLQDPTSLNPSQGSTHSSTINTGIQDMKTISDAQAALNKLSGHPLLTIFCEQSSARSSGDLPDSVIIANDHRTVRFDASMLRQKQFVQLLMVLNNHQWIGHDLKQSFRALLRLGLTDIEPIFDTMIASYLLNAGSRAHTLEHLARIELKRELHFTQEGQQKLIADASETLQRTAERLQTIRELAPLLEKRLHKENLWTLYDTIERPLIAVLARMENAGITVDTDYLRTLSKKVHGELGRLEKRVIALAGESFNVNSPQQLKRILFEVLRLPTKGIGKTKTGLSTAAEELEKLKLSHPIIEKILEHRELAKLANTYIDTLPALVNPATLRIHTTYHQAVAATGRLSSSDPNLQNIPIRTEIGSQVRNAFVADHGMRLVSLDYNQIELRIVASLSKDVKMLKSFRSGEDIHAATAAEVFDVPIGKVTAEMRRTAKTVNFGVLYGLGARGLSQTTGLSLEEARDFIETYFTIYSGVKAFMESSVEQAKRNGFVETLFGRRRYLPDIASTIPQLKAQAERMAGNMPIQGTAADLMKLAMIRIDGHLSDWSKQTRMLLQVHDELVFEVPINDVETVARHAGETMSAVATLSCPIVVHAKTGSRWGSMEPLRTRE